MAGCLILHGYTGGPFEVAPLATYLRKVTDWDIQVPTLPGHGKNSSLEGISYRNWLDAAEESLQHLQSKTNDTYIVGFSMGGMIAAYLAAKYKVSRLVLLAPSGKYLHFRQIGIDILKFVVDGMQRKLKQNKLYIRYKRKVGTVPLRSSIEFMKLVRLTRRYLPSVTSKVLIAQGRRDGIVPYNSASYLDEEIGAQHKEIVLFDRSKHLICLGEDRDVLNDMVHRFLADPESDHEQPG